MKVRLEKGEWNDYAAVPFVDGPYWSPSCYIHAPYDSKGIK